METFFRDRELPGDICGTGENLVDRSLWFVVSVVDVGVNSQTGQRVGKVTYVTRRGVRTSLTNLLTLYTVFARAGKM